MFNAYAHKINFTYFDQSISIDTGIYSSIDVYMKSEFDKCRKKISKNTSIKDFNNDQDSLDKIISMLNNIDIILKNQENTKIKNSIHSFELMLQNYKNKWQTFIINNNKLENMFISLIGELKKSNFHNILKNGNFNQIESIINQIKIDISRNDSFYISISWFVQNVYYIFILLLTGFTLKKQNPQYKSLKIKQILINQKTDDLQFVLLPEKEDSKSFDSMKSYVEKFKEIFSFSHEKCNQKNVNQKDVSTPEEYFKQKVLNLIDGLNKIAEFDFSSDSPKNILNHIQYIIFNQFPIKNKAFFEMFYSLNKFYNSFVGNTYLMKSYEKIIQIYKSHNNSSKITTGPTKQLLYQMYDEIKRQGKYFYLDTLFHIMMTNLLDQDLFRSKLYEIIKKYQDEISSITYIKDMHQFNDLGSTFQLLYDNDINFVLLKTYSNDLCQKEREKEFRLFNKDYSKFIVHLDESKTKTNTQYNRIYIPFFPLGTLEYIINNRYLNSSKRRIELSFVDKIVIILEIATGLDDLHSNNEYHGNFSDKSVFINSTKDAYIGCFCYDNNSEKELTKPKGPFYFRSPEFFNEDINNEEVENDEDFYKKKRMNDIYSFGVLMHEIITDTPPEVRMENHPRDSRINILRSSYKGFLFSGENNEYFDDMIDLKNIIEKCLSINQEERFASMKDIINSLKAMPFYEKNKEEIEYRFSNAAEGKNYKCSVADIVESYYRGDENANTCILDFLKAYNNSVYEERTIEFSDDIIKNIFEVFDIKFNNDLTYIFNDVFNLIIRNCVNDRNNNFIDYNDNLLLLANDIIAKQYLPEEHKKDELENDHNGSLIIPFSSLANFIKYNENIIENLKPTWIYIISKELQYIHSKKLYHGSLSLNNIGIYYNHETQTFVPSIILYYSFLNRLKKNQFMKTDLANKQYSRNHIISEYQKKDIKQLIKIIKIFDIIPENDIEEIEDSDSINEIVFKLYNFNLNNDKMEQKNIFLQNISHLNYSSFEITYPVLREIFSSKNNISFEGSFIEIEKINQTIIEFLNNIENNPSNSIFESIPQVSISHADGQQNNSNIDRNMINQQFTDIITKCSFLFYNVLNENMKFQDLSVEIKKAGDSIVIEGKKNKKANNIKNFIKEKCLPDYQLISLWENKKKMKDKKIEALRLREVFRHIEVYGLCKESFNFLLTRYIKNLNPSIKYRLKIKIVNLTFLETTNNSIKINDIKKIVKAINPNWKEPEPHDAEIIVYINIY